MEIDVEIFGQLFPGLQRRQTVSLPRSMNVKEVAELLSLNLDEVGMIVIDGVLSLPEETLTSDCRLCFFPPMTGG